MSISGPNALEQIEKRICELQRAHVLLQEKLKKMENNFEAQLDDAALRIIDILDLIILAKTNRDLDSESNTQAQLILKKVEKRLSDILKRWQIQEIILKGDRVEVGKTRVLETRNFSGETAAGSIVEVCRKGYQRGNKIIRPSDVITVEEK